MSSFNQIQTACGVLGYFDSQTYLKDDNCEDALRVLLRCLKYENERKDARLQMLESKIIENDLIPMLIHLNPKHDEKILHHALKLLVNLTKPPLVCFDGKLPRDVALINVYLKIETQLQKTKTNLANEKLFNFLVDKVQPVLDKEWLDRSDDDDFIVHAVFTLVRNILSIRSEREISEESDINTHDLVLWSLHKSNMENLILYCGNKAQGDERIMNLLEIVVLMLREQSAEELANTGAQQNKNRREKNNETLDLLYQRELAEKQQKQKLSSNRSAFGGATYVMGNAKGIGENQLICHRPLQSLNAIEFDREKRRMRRPKNRAPVQNDPDDQQHHHSALGIRLFLREFCLAFLENCYNILMPRAREMLMKSTCLLSDETNFFWAVRFFTEFNRHTHLSVDRISETLQMNTFHLFHTRMDHYREMIKIDKPEAKLWAKRLQIGFSAFKEYMLTVKWMLTNPEPMVVRAATIIKNNIFYMQEYREQIFLLLKDFDNTKMTKAFLHDLIESTHEFLKLFEEHTAKLKHVFVQRRRAARKATKSKKKSKKKKEVEEDEPPNEQLIDVWENEIFEKISRLLHGIDCLTIDKSDVCPFDALSEVPVDDQSVTAVARIQHALRNEKFDEAIALLRASREVWQTEKAFGHENINPDDELKLLKEIYLTSNLQKLLPKNLDETEEEEEEVEEPEKDEGIGEQEEEEEVRTVEREEEFDLKKFIRRFAHSNVLSSYINVLRTYATNSSLLNHCLIRMFYRVCVDCECTPMLFQMSLFRILQKFHLDPLAKSSQFSEILQFGTWLLRKFFNAAQKNPCIFAEILFWKDRSIIDEILDGNRPSTRDNPKEKVKSGAWSIEEQIELRDLFRKFKEEQDENIGLEKGDLVDRIFLELSSKDKTRRQVIKELKLQGLIKSTRELKIKKSSARRSKKKEDIIDSSDSDVERKSPEPQSDNEKEEESEEEEEEPVPTMTKTKKPSRKLDQSDEDDDEPVPTLAKTKASQKLDENDDDDDEPVPTITKQSRKLNQSDDNNDDDDEPTTPRPIKKARRQLASSSEDED